MPTDFEKQILERDNEVSFTEFAKAVIEAVQLTIAAAPEREAAKASAEQADLDAEMALVEKMRRENPL